MLLGLWLAAIAMAEALIALERAPLGLALYVVLLAVCPFCMTLAPTLRPVLAAALLVVPVVRLLAAALLVPGALGPSAAPSALGRQLAPLIAAAARSLGLAHLPATTPEPALDHFATAALLMLLVERELALGAGVRFRPFVRTATLAAIPMLLAFLATAALRLSAAG